MLLATLLVGMAVMIGTLTGGVAPISILTAGIWAFIAGMLVAINQAATDLGVTTLVTLVVFSAQPLAPHQALSAGSLAIAGGLLQTLLALALWPVEGHQPERTALANLFDGLARAAKSPTSAFESPPASSEATAAHNTLATLAAVHTIEADRYRSLLNQAERMRLGLLMLSRPMRVRRTRRPRSLLRAQFQRPRVHCAIPALQRLHRPRSTRAGRNRRARRSASPQSRRLRHGSLS